MSELIIVGGGLAGSEAAWQAAESGVKVILHEMRPQKKTPAHKTSYMAELVCSNSLRSNNHDDPVGLLKEELRRLGSLIIKTADNNAVPAGKALAVDRKQFAESVTRAICTHPNISIRREEITDIPASPSIIATGPLTSDILASKIEDHMGKENLYFYDAIAPIIDSDSIDLTKSFFASRYENGGADYLNCPLTREEYYNFYDELIKGEKTPLREFEKPRFFAGCMPIEEIAIKGRESLPFGVMRPVGLKNPDENKGKPYAVLQLRREDTEGKMFNMVGFQTRLRHPEQKRIFRMIPGLENAEILRYGNLHRNTYMNSPESLYPTLECKKKEGLFFAGQITGVEGYVESTASGCLAGIIAAGRLLGRKKINPFPDTTAIGSLIRHITSPARSGFQPMNINLGLFPGVTTIKLKKKEKKRLISERALTDLERWIKENEIL